MKTNTINGLMFMIAGLTPFVVYLGLGPDGTALLSAARTEQLFAYLFFSFPIAVMMTRKIQSNYLTDAGLLILVASASMGMVADALGADAELSQMSDAVSITAYSSVMLGALLYGLGAFQTSIFPKWLSGLFAVVAGAVGGGLGTDVILILGFSSVFADAVSMGIGDALSTKSENDYILMEKHVKNGNLTIIQKVK